MDTTLTRCIVVKDLVESVSGYKDLSDKCRIPSAIELKMIYCVLARKYTGATLNTIGKAIGVHHSTVIHHIKGYNNLTEVGCFVSKTIYKLVATELDVKMGKFIRIAVSKNVNPLVTQIEIRDDLLERLKVVISKREVLTVQHSVDLVEEINEVLRINK